MKQSAFELFLDGLDPEWREHQLGFFRIMAAAGPDAVEELAGRVYQVSCPAGLKRLALEFSYYFPWPEWSAVIDRILKHEKNLAFFETGARALGKIRTPAALESLRNLSLSRATPGFREIVDQVLRETDPAEAFQHHFSRLLKGSAQPGDANEGAHQLARVIGPGNLEPLKAGVNHPDPLVFRHALRLICLIQSREAAAVLFDYLNEAQLDATEDREARGILAEFRALPRPEVREKALRSLSGRWEEKKPEAVVDLVSGQADRVQAAATMLRRVSADTLDALLADTLLAALDEKPAQLAEFLTQAGETAQNRARRVDFALQTAAEGLADMAGRGLIAPGLLLPALAEPLRQGTGNAGVATALARLVPPSNQDLLDLLLDQTEGSLRSAALEVLGGRQDPAFRESLLKLRRDPIADIADRSLWHLGQLPEAAGTARALLAHSDPDEVLVGLRFIAMHKLQDLVPELLDLAARESRESPLLATYKTLGQVGSPHAVGPLLGLLQTSLAPGIRVAIAEALRDLGDATGALGLCAKAGELKSPELCTVAVEAFARAHDSADRPLPASNSALLVAMTQCGWSSRHPWPLRLRIADALVAIHGPDRALWVEVANHLQSTLSEKRSPGAVSTEDVAHLQACARILAQKAQG
jgi:HEAT repeat protein